MSEVAGEAGRGRTGDVAPTVLRAWERHLGEPVPATLRSDLAAGTIPQIARATARRAGGRIAVSVDGQALTHTELVTGMDRTAAALAARGVAAGDRVLLCASSSTDLVVAYLGVLAAGATAVLANPGLTGPELAHHIRDSGAVLALAEERLHGLLRAEGGTGMDVAGLVPDLTWGTAPVPGGPTSDSVAILAYTSGTTGVPKGTPLTHANVLASTRGVLRAWRWSGDDVCVHALPLYHQHGLSAVHAAVVSGSATHVLSRLEAAALGETAARRRMSVVFAVPAVYQRLAAEDALDVLRVSSLRLAVSGSAPLSEELARTVGDALGAVPLERYGTTESGLDLSNPYIGPRRPGRVGQPLPGVEVRLCDDEGRPVPAGREGEICVRGPQVFGGYWQRPEATTEGFWPGGWFRTGDIGVCDPADGSYAVVGRSKELIVTGGLNVYPREVELALASHPAVADVAVAGVPSARWGEEVTAFVVPVRGTAIDGPTLLAHARGRLASYKCPKRVVTVEALPRNALGKVLRGRLAERD